jgi:monoamine oxidase
MAGLTAARELQKKGFAVTVYEKSHGAGGRYGFALFCTPRFQGKVPPAREEILARAERLHRTVEGHGVAGYR